MTERPVARGIYTETSLSRSRSHATGRYILVLFPHCRAIGENFHSRIIMCESFATGFRFWTEERTDDGVNRSICMYVRSDDISGEGTGSGGLLVS